MTRRTATFLIITGTGAGHHRNGRRDRNAARAAARAAIRRRSGEEQRGTSSGHDEPYSCAVRME